MRTTLTAAVLIGAALLAGCSSKSSPFGATQNVWALTGTVTATSPAGTPLVGATAKILDGPNANQTTVTSGTGGYAFSKVVAGTFQLQVTADGYTSQTQNVTLSKDTVVDFALSKAPTANLVSEGGATAAAQPDGSYDFAFNGRNTGSGCALQVSGATLLGDVNGTPLTTVNWSLPAGTSVAPGQPFTYHVVTSSTVASLAGSYVTQFSWANSGTTTCP